MPNTKNCPLDPSKNFIKTCTGEDGDLKLNFLNIKQPKKYGKTDQFTTKCQRDRVSALNSKNKNYC